MRMHILDMAQKNLEKIKKIIDCGAKKCTQLFFNGKLEEENCFIHFCII